MKGLSLLLLVLAVFCVCEGKLFASSKTDNFGNDPKRVSSQVGELDPVSGNFSTVGTTLVLQDGGFIYSVASTFDQVNQIFYYYGDGPFIYGINIASSSPVAPIFVGALESIQSLAWTNDQLYILGTDRNTGLVVYSYPPSAPAKILVNVESLNLPPYAQVTFAADPVSGNGYLVYTKDSVQGVIALVTFTPTGVVNVTQLGCQLRSFNTDRIFYDPIANKLVGVGETSKTYYFEQLDDGTCSSKLFDSGYLLSDVAYDPTTSTVYVYGLDETSGYVATWVTSADSSKIVPAPANLKNLVASYKL
eukprot:Phypoly_transcript_10191.p1 GENE.Phypoly_transcript_10191~~Phypoly_transcript_10191.p1  ORF type:complete len:305 (+),score=47.27 Phypoly_transcript_10191:390-1304(+)